ncbi:MAG: thiamine pyrophosphate-dependent enzyme [bacterium]
MPRLLGLALASKLFRNNPALKEYTSFSRNGDEVAFGMISDASTSEGHFWETMNAAGVLQVPLAMAVWDDGFGISVPQSYQTTKQSISESLKGFERTKDNPGILIYQVIGWDYPALYAVFEEGIRICRKDHVPVLFHVRELTQPQGHSTSGSHERYKSPERLAWEKEYDCIRKMREWILSTGLATAEELDRIEEESVGRAKEARNKAWKHYQAPIKAERQKLIDTVKTTHCPCKKQAKIDRIVEDLGLVGEPIRKDVISSAKKILRDVCLGCSAKKPMVAELRSWLDDQLRLNADRYSSHLYSESEQRAININGVPPVFTETSPVVTGREVLLANNDYIFKTNPLAVTFGEDVGHIGGVNQTYEGLQVKYGERRIFNTGIREATIIGQGIGLALRGMRPIAEEAIPQLKDFNISVELIDVQSLVPFDLYHDILKSLQKTNKILFFDEDVPGGATAYMMHEYNPNKYPRLY